MSCFKIHYSVNYGEQGYSTTTQMSAKSAMDAVANIIEDIAKFNLNHYDDIVDYRVESVFQWLPELDGWILCPEFWYMETSPSNLKDQWNGFHL